MGRDTCVMLQPTPLSLHQAEGLGSLLPPQPAMPGSPRYGMSFIPRSRYSEESPAWFSGCGALTSPTAPLRCHSVTLATLRHHRPSMGHGGSSTSPLMLQTHAPGASPRIGWLGSPHLHNFNKCSHIPLKLKRVGRRRSAGRAGALPSETRGKFPLLIP